MGFRKNKKENVKHSENKAESTPNIEMDIKNNKRKRKKKRKSTRKERFDMYDMLLANRLAGNSIIEPEEDLDNSEISISYANIASRTSISKYFVITNFPDWMDSGFINTVRRKCILPGVKVDFYIYTFPYRIPWESPEMKNRLSIWKSYTDEAEESVSVFDYRAKRDVSLNKERIIWSTRYLNEAELDHKRTTMKVTFLIKFTAKRTDEAIINLSNSIKTYKAMCSASDIKTRELRGNLIDWISCLGVMSLRDIKEIGIRKPRKIMTDDILANFNSYKQGRVGEDGILLGIDVLSMVPVLKKFKADPDAPENWLISAETGGGKSYFVKALLTWLLADNFVVTVMDYEGDEYYNLANYIRASNPDDVKVISMGKGSTVYFDPMEIAELTGDEEVDSELKETAIAYTLSIFRLLACGIDGTMSQAEEKVVSTAIKRVYYAAGVTENKETWKRSRGLRLSMVYDELKGMVEYKEYVDETTDNVKHKALVKLVENASIYFEEGEAKSGTFKNPMSVNELFKAKFIVFSFGMKGETSSQTDPVVLALKQLAVSNVGIQISNHCKYIRKCFNVKVWEEFQRWGEIPGSADLISNAITGGRKRGDVNIVITNDISSILDDSNVVNRRLRLNTQSFAIGSIKDKDVRHEFCEKFNLLELEPALALIAKANNAENKSASKSGKSSRYKHAFCAVLDNGKKAVIKVTLPRELRESKLFKTGVDIEEGD